MVTQIACKIFLFLFCFNYLFIYLFCVCLSPSPLLFTDLNEKKNFPDTFINLI